MKDAFGILTLNIGNPAVERAERQLDWLSARSEDVLVLTETCDSKGTRLIAERLAGAGWDVRLPLPADGERGVLVASRVRLAARAGDVTPYLPARAELVGLAGATLDVIGVYVPSRDESTVKTERKRRFVSELATALDRRPERSAVLIGDLNILEPQHRPRRHEFVDWEYAVYDGLLGAGWLDAYRLAHPDAMEYSWVGHHDDGYRFDHAFVTSDLRDRVATCGYAHETRELGLTDHSAMLLELTAIPVERLEVEASLSGDPMALF